MGFEIIWTQKAINTFSQRINYLQENWTEREIFNFTERVNEYLVTLKNPTINVQKINTIKAYPYRRYY